MELCLFDESFTLDSINNLKNQFGLSGYNTKSIEEAEKDLPQVDKLNLFVGLHLNFLSKNVITFFDRLHKLKLLALKIDIVMVERLEDNSKYAIEWLIDLKTNYFPNLNVVSEISYDEIEGSKSKLKLKLSETQNSKPMIEKSKTVTIYTDGACSGNPGAGGWGAVLIHGERKKEISGFDPLTTNNQMELTAVIKALEMLKESCNVELFSDSAYVVNAINQNWLNNWKSNGWIGADKKQVKNLELWIKLDSLLSKHNVHFNKVKGHADNELNNRCDALATGEIAKNANNQTT